MHRPLRKVRLHAVTIQRVKHLGHWFAELIGELPAVWDELQRRTVINEINGIFGMGLG